MEDKVLLSVWVVTQIRKDVRKIAVSQDISVSSWIRRAIKEKLERDTPPHP